jgi:hypothetical protein
MLKKCGLNITFLFILSGLGIFVPNRYAHAYISEQDCLAFDYQHRMGPTRDQGEDGQCWAFAASALLEEQRCIEEPLSCGKSLSPLDTSRCEWSVGKQEQGGLVRYGLNCGLKNGVCEEEKAPYDNRVAMDLECLDTQTPARSSCADPKSFSDYQQFLQQQNLYPSPILLNCPIKKSTASQSLDPLMSKDLLEPDEASSVEKDYLLPPKALFKKKQLLTAQCQEQRHQFSKDSRRHLKGRHINFKGGHRRPDQTPSDEKYKVLRSLVEKHQRSVSLSVCVNKIQALSSLYGGESGCSGHAVVANGSRWINGQCQLHIKNSWGKIPKDHPAKTTLNEWVDADQVLNATFEMEYIGPKKK